MPTLPWSAIDTVLLDMDGTLLDLHFDNHFWLEHLPQRYAERNGLSRAEADAVLEPLFREHAGQLNWYCLDFWSRELDLSIRELKHEVAHLISLRPHADTFLAALRRLSAATDKPLAVCVQGDRLHVFVTNRILGQKVSSRVPPSAAVAEVDFLPELDGILKASDALV